MVMNKVAKDIPAAYAEQYGVFEGELANIKPYQDPAARLTQ